MIHQPKTIWITPQEWHTEEQPFCEWQDCACHFDKGRVERYIVQPIERHEIDIPAGLARYYHREEVNPPMHTATHHETAIPHVTLVNELIDPATPIGILSQTLYTLELMPLTPVEEEEEDLEATEKREAVQVYVDYNRIPPISPLLLEREREVA